MIKIDFDNEDVVKAKISDLSEEDLEGLEVVGRFNGDLLHLRAEDWGDEVSYRWYSLTNMYQVAVPKIYESRIVAIKNSRYFDGIYMEQFVIDLILRLYQKGIISYRGDKE